jgi:hypothetical protein
LEGINERPSSRSWDEYNGANGDDAGADDDEARVSDGKSQQVGNQKHRRTM